MFNGASDILTSESAPVLSGSTSVTYAFAYKEANSATDNIAWDGGYESSAQGPKMLVKWSGDNTKDLLYWTAGGGQYIVSFARPSTGNWHFYQITINPAGSNAGQLEGIFQVYIDGMSSAVTKIADTSPNTTWANGTFYFGGNGAGSFVSGEVSMIGIWKAALTSDNAASLAACADPLTVGSINYYWPIKQVSPETPDAGAINLTVTGTSNSDSPCMGGSSSDSHMLLMGVGR
jgi:hypothetical protein